MEKAQTRALETRARADAKRLWEQIAPREGESAHAWRARFDAFKRERQGELENLHEVAFYTVRLCGNLPGPADLVDKVKGEGEAFFESVTALQKYHLTLEAELLARRK